MAIGGGTLPSRAGDDVGLRPSRGAALRARSPPPEQAASRPQSRDSTSTALPAERSGGAANPTGGSAEADGLQEQKVSPTVPDIPALKDTAKGPDSGSQPNDHGRHASSAARLPVDTELIPGGSSSRSTWPTRSDWLETRSLDIAVARQQIFAATADLMAARALWLPSLFYGPSWYRSDGQIQTVTGQVQTINRSALFLVERLRWQTPSRGRHRGPVFHPSMA